MNTENFQGPRFNHEKLDEWFISVYGGSTIFHY